jgi:hypothetical protein
MSLVVLSPVHYALFGPYWFTYNPPPYIVKEGPAYILLFIEALLILWSLMMLIWGYYAQTRNKLYSTVMGILTYIVITAALYFYPFLPIA